MHCSVQKNKYLESPMPKHAPLARAWLLSMLLLGARPSSVTLTERLGRIKDECGALCRTDRAGSAGLFFDHIQADVNCTSLIGNPYWDAGHAEAVAPRHAPDEWVSEYTMGGRVPLVDLYVDERRFALSISKWSELHLRTLASRAHRGILHGMYGVNETEALRDGLRRAAGIRGACAAHAVRRSIRSRARPYGTAGGPWIEGGRVLVVGSETPWVEACLLEAGAAQIVTLEYAQGCHARLAPFCTRIGTCCADYSAASLSAGMGALGCNVSVSHVRATVRSFVRAACAPECAGMRVRGYPFGHRPAAGRTRSTVRYMRIASEHAAVRTIIPAEFRAMYATTQPLQPAVGIRRVLKCAIASVVLPVVPIAQPCALVRLP